MALPRFSWPEPDCECLGCYDREVLEAALARGFVQRRSQGYRVGLVVMGCFYIMAGVNHLIAPQFYLVVMPPYIPWPAAMVLVSGIAEILGGIGVLVPDGVVFPSVRRFAAWGIVLMLAAFLPVHINMCLHPEAFPRIPLWVIWARLPLQLPLMLWAWWYALD